MKSSSAVVAVISHEVKDYDLWRNYFNSTENFRKANGVIQSDVYRCPQNPNKVFVTQRYSSLADAKAFLANDEWKENMQKAGVSSKPDLVLGVAA